MLKKIGMAFLILLLILPLLAEEKAEYSYKNGMFDGAVKTFYDNDTLRSIQNYENG